MFPEQREGKDGDTNLELIQGLGQTQVPVSESTIHAMTIVGQIEGHMILPPQNKTTKYEHISAVSGHRARPKDSRIAFDPEHSRR
ncbi:MAG: Translocation-enhancing protein TepA [Firmicutes bacterium]|nr:Translocation-enhancing protein TepA [Bacillota bacterium]